MMLVTLQALVLESASGGSAGAPVPVDANWALTKGRVSIAGLWFFGLGVLFTLCSAVVNAEAQIAVGAWLSPTEGYCPEGGVGLPPSKCPGVPLQTS